VTTPSNPYGRRPGGGISLPDYYRPTPSIKNRNAYFGGTEPLPPGEMRICFLGSTPWPPTRSQSGTSMMVELGTDAPQPRRFFFDMGNGSVKNALALQVPPALINDIFISHLHSDHYADLPYSYPFTAWSGRWQPLRLYGPSGRTPELGIAHMAKHMREMNRWHEDNFNHVPIGDGFEMDVTEFDWKDENGVCYEQDGVVVRHWPRSHVKDGASAYRLDWEEYDLSFVWTGDGRPDEKTAKYAAGADVFVSEGQLDTPALQALKFGMPSEVVEYTIDSWHTMYYAAGYLFKQVNPRIAAICHYEAGGGATEAESIAEIRSHWDGLFMWGGPDVQILNVTKDAIWAREAALPEGVAVASMDPRMMMPPGAALPEKIELPRPKIPREEQQEQFLRDMEVDPHLYYPPDVDREPVQVWPEEGISLEPKKMLKARGIDVDAEEEQ
jgi:ribonuclease Z